MNIRIPALISPLIAFAFTLGLALVSPPASSAEGEIVTVGVGMVRNTAITSREVQMKNLLELALYDPASKSKLKRLALDSKAFSKAVQDALLENVLALEAQSFNLMEVSADEVKTAERTALKVLRDEPAWRSLDVAPQELENNLRRKLQAKKFIQFRAESSVLPVTDQEAQRYFQENQFKYGDLPFENLRENIKSYLSKSQVEKRLKDWFEVLLAKYQVKNLIAEM